MATCPNCGNGITQQLPFCPHCGKPVGTFPLSEGFKIVTVVFCDVVGSTELGHQLDDVPMRKIMDRYGEIVRRVLGAHGGSVGRRHGDGFMAAFGIPEVHEDDALRAVRAVAELSATLRQLDEELEAKRGLSLKVRIGVNTGTVLVRDAGAIEDEVTGETVTVARRFEQAADSGHILIGAETYRLVQHAVRAEPADPIVVDGLPARQDVWRLLGVLPDRPARVRRLDAPLIGRGLEQELLLRLFDRVVAERSCHLVSLLGYAGVGKSRLVDEFAGVLGDRATVLRGHCLHYGDSTALWPMVQIVRQAANVKPTDPPPRVHKCLVDLMRQVDRGQQIAGRVAQILGFGLDQSVELPEDTVWALRRLLETKASEQPLVVVIDDLQWADPTLLDAIENIAETARDTPIMLICIARPDELFPRRRHWPGGKVNSSSFLLSPLGYDEGEQLVGHLLGGEVEPRAQAHIAEWAQGYPLIVEELVANLRDEDKLRPTDGVWKLHLDGGGKQAYPGADAWGQADRRPRVSVPTSIQALLLARLGRLDPGTQAVIERAAVVGEQFHSRDVEVLSTGSSTETDLHAGLEELVRLDLVRPDHALPAVPLPPGSGEGYRFRHIMIRTVVYERMPDDRRAALHERYGDWLETNTEDRRSQFDELVGYHLYEAYLYAHKLDPNDDHTRALARRTGERHAAAGLRAALRGDSQLTVAWLGRAAKLLPADHPDRLKVLRPLAEALQATGQLNDAMKAYDEIVDAANRDNDDGLAAHATIGRLYVTAFHNPERFLAHGREEIESVIRVFDRLEDPRGLAASWYLLAYRNWALGRLASARSAAERATTFAREAGDEQWEARIIGLHGLLLYWGPTPLDEVEKHSQYALSFARRTGTPALQADAFTVLARVAALRGQFDKARELLSSARVITAGLGGLLTLAADCISEALIQLLSDQLPAAEETLRAGDKELERMGGTGPRANVVAMLARVLLLRGNLDGVEEATRICEQIAPKHQLDAQIKWRAIRAVVLARRGESERAEDLARDAVNRADESDQFDSRAEAHVDLAEVLRLGERHGEAKRELELALWLYKEKGNEVGVRNVSKLLGRSMR